MRGAKRNVFLVRWSAATRRGWASVPSWRAAPPTVRRWLFFAPPPTSVFWLGGPVLTQDKVTELTDRVTTSRAWRSFFRHGPPDTPRNRALAVFSNVFLHLHPVRVPRESLRVTYTFCLGGISF